MTWNGFGATTRSRSGDDESPRRESECGSPFRSGEACLSKGVVELAPVEPIGLAHGPGPGQQGVRGSVLEEPCGRRGIETEFGEVSGRGRDLAVHPGSPAGGSTLQRADEEIAHKDIGLLTHGETGEMDGGGALVVAHVPGR